MALVPWSNSVNVNSTGAASGMVRQETLASGNTIAVYSASINGLGRTYSQLIDPSGNLIGAPAQIQYYGLDGTTYLNVTSLTDGGYIIISADGGNINNLSYGRYSEEGILLHSVNADGYLSGVGGNPESVFEGPNGVVHFIFGRYDGIENKTFYYIKSVDANGVSGTTSAFPTPLAAWNGTEILTLNAGILGDSIGGRFYDTSGNPLGSAFDIATTTAGGQGSPVATSLGDGRFVVLWVDTSHTGADTSGSAIRGQIIDSNGTKFGAEFLVNTAATGDQDSPSIAALPNGGFVVAYESNDYIYAQTFDASGAKTGSETLITAGNATRPDVDALPDGRVSISWKQGSNGYFQIFDPREGTIDGTPNAETLYGSDFAGDIIRGFAGADILFGLGGDDWLTGGHGNDRIFGGDGHDRADFSNAFATATITRLLNGSIRVVTPDDGTDILRGIESLRFSDRTIDVTGLARTDLNGDGDSDILMFRQSTGEISRFDMTGGFATGSTPVQVEAASSGNWDTQAVGDFSADANADIVQKNVATGAFRIHTVLNGLQVGERDLGIVGTNWDVRATGDFNADGVADLLWRNSDNGQFYVWTFNSSVLQTGGASIGTFGANWNAATAGDFDGDGDSDILLRDDTDGRLYAFEMQNGAQVAGHSIATLGAAWVIASTGDYNDDGHTDIAVKHTSTGQFYLLQMNDQFTYTGSDLGEIGPSWMIAASGDYNADGTDDILWRNTTTGQVYAWQMDSGHQAAAGSSHLGYLSSDLVIV